MISDSETDLMTEMRRRFVSTATREKARLLWKRMVTVTKQLGSSPMGVVGTVILAFFLVLGIFGEQLAPYSVAPGEYDQRFGKSALPTELGTTEMVVINPDQFVEITGEFVPKPGWPGPDPARYGLLRVTAEPSVPTTIYIDGEWRATWGLNWLKLSPMNHTVVYSDVPGYVTPSPVIVDVKGGAKVSEVVAEFAQSGELNVTLYPRLPANVTVDGIPRSVGGLHSYVSAGAYNLSFGPVEGYVAPANQTITVVSGELLEINATYVPDESVPAPDYSGLGTLRVQTAPAVPTTIYVNGSWRSMWGLDELRLEPGKYVIDFTDVPGFVTPNSQVVEIVAGQAIEIVEEFKRCGVLSVRTIPSIPSTIYVNNVPRNDRELFVYVPNGTYYVTFRSVQDYAVPTPDSATLLMHVLPYLTSLAAIGVTGYVVFKPSEAAGRRKAIGLAMVALAITLLIAVLVSFGAMNFIDFAEPDWFLPLSIVGAVASVVCLALMQVRFDREVRIGLLFAVLSLVPLIAAAWADLDPFAMSSLLLAAYAASGMFVGMAFLSLHKSFKRSIAAFSGSGRDAEALSRRVMRTLKVIGPIAAGLFVVSGAMFYLVQHWTTHWMGTDVFGYDVFSELLYGAKTSIVVGVFSALIASVLGAIVGLYSGYVGGWPDEVIMRFNDVVLSIPWLVLMIIIAAMLGKIDLLGIILIIGLTGWSPTARMVRAQVLSIRERQYVERAKAIGSTDLGIIRRHVLPNSFPLVFANTILTVAISILSEATLSFLGMRPVGAVTWGSMLSFAQDENAFALGLLGWIVAPGLFIVLIVLGFSLLGYALDDIMNPKLRKR